MPRTRPTGSSRPACSTRTRLANRSRPLWARRSRLAARSAIEGRRAGWSLEGTATALPDGRARVHRLQPLPHVADEAADLRAVGGAMVEADADVHHRPDADGVAVRCLDDDGPLDDRLHGEDGDLGHVDDGLAGDRAEPARVVDGEGAALDVLEHQAPGAGTAGQVLDGLVEAADRERVGIVDDGDHG